MNAARADATRAWDAARLRDEGFEGFHAAAALRRSGCLEVPVERGVYIVVRDTDEAPAFMARSVGGRYRQQDPTEKVEALQARWVPGARLLYVGRAAGPGVRSLLQQRVKRLLRFGQGRAIAHRGGRFVWQLADHASLRIAWRTTPDGEPAAVEAALLADFVRLHGAPPFANEGAEDGA